MLDFRRVEIDISGETVMRNLSVVVKRKQEKRKVRKPSKPKLSPRHIMKRTQLPFLTSSSFKLKEGVEWYE